MRAIPGENQCWIDEYVFGDQVPDYLVEILLFHQIMRLVGRIAGPNVVREDAIRHGGKGLFSVAFSFDWIFNGRKTNPTTMCQPVNPCIRQFVGVSRTDVNSNAQTMAMGFLVCGSQNIHRGIPVKLNAIYPFCCESPDLSSRELRIPNADVRALDRTGTLIGNAVQQRPDREDSRSIDSSLFRSLFVSQDPVLEIAEVEDGCDSIMQQRLHHPTVEVDMAVDQSG